MAALQDLKIEIEVKIFRIIPITKKWWEFWRPKSKRVLISGMNEVTNDITN